jgi:hypothetical protein
MIKVTAKATVRATGLNATPAIKEVTFHITAPSILMAMQPTRNRG